MPKRNPTRHKVRVLTPAKPLGPEKGEGRWGKGGKGTESEQAMYYILLRLYHLQSLPLLCKNLNQ